MSEHRYAIFDLDGTLLDSMPVWRDFGKNYLLSRGIKPPKNLGSILKEQTLEESAIYFREQLNVPGSQEEILASLHTNITKEYDENVPLKPYARKYLDLLTERGITMCIATATPGRLAALALKRLNLERKFAFLMDCAEVGSGKNSPEIYLRAAQKLNAPIQSCAVYEDALHAIQTAKAAGFYVVGVKDPSAQTDAETIRLECDRYIRSYRELLNEPYGGKQNV